MSGEDKMDMQEDGADGPIQMDARVFKPPVQESSEPDIASRVPVPLKTGKYDNRYNMEYKRRGMAFIFNFYKYSLPHVKAREGSETDVIKLKQTFEYLQFKVEVHDNLTVEALTKKLKEVSLDDHNDCDCLAVAVMTHGNIDGLWAYDKKFQQMDLWNPFTADNCRTLAGKPKLFFIQACRGEKLDKSVRVMDIGRTEEKPIYTIPTTCDILMAYASFEGHASIRHKSKGTWFIQSLCNELLENGKRKSLLSLLTAVIRRVAFDRQLVFDLKSDVILKQQPVIVSTLSHKVYFKDKQAGSSDK